jgi:AcrR family transcriptional regulator
MSAAQIVDPARSSRGGRPRDPSRDGVIRAAILRLLADVGYGALTMDAVAAEAGVGKATIYRRWSGKEELFVDVVRTAEPPDAELPGTSMRDDLVALLEQLRLRGLMARSSALLHSVFAQMKSSPKVWDAYHTIVIAPRRRKQVAILRRGQANGELRTDIDVELVNDLFIGPMLFRTIMQPNAELPEGLSEQIVDTVLEGLRPVSS